jgi:glycosyltransferase involved in cell wall biosynthesis
MRILQIVKYYYPSVSFGGPVQCVLNISKYMVRKGHEVTVYTTDAGELGTRARIPENFRQIDGVKIFYFRNLIKSLGFFVSPGMIDALYANINHFDIVHLHEFRTFQNVVFYRVNKGRVPYVLSCHGEFVYREEPWTLKPFRKLFDRAFGRSLVEGANKMLALTKFEAEQYRKAGIESDRITLIPNAVEPFDFSNPSKGSIQNLMNREKVVLYLGRLHKRKGIDILVRAFSLASKKRSDVKLVLGGPDDGFKNKLRRIVDQLDIEDRVIFMGSLNREQVLAAYERATVVVYPSIQEGFPLVPLEAGIMGKPVIVSDDPAMDFVRNGRYGLTVKYGSVSDLYEALDEVLSNPEMSRRMGKNGKKFIMENYSWESIGKNIEAVYQEVSCKCK